MRWIVMDDLQNRKLIRGPGIRKYEYEYAFPQSATEMSEGNHDEPSRQRRCRHQSVIDTSPGAVHPR